MKYEVIIYKFKCLGCGRQGTATNRINIPCLDCGGELEYKMIVPQGTDEAPIQQKEEQPSNEGA